MVTGRRLGESLILFLDEVVNILLFYFDIIERGHLWCLIMVASVMFWSPIKCQALTNFMRIFWRVSEVLCDIRFAWLDTWAVQGYRVFDHALSTLHFHVVLQNNEAVCIQYIAATCQTFFIRAFQTHHLLTFVWVKFLELAVQHYCVLQLPRKPHHLFSGN